MELMRPVRHPHLHLVFGAWIQEGFLILAMELADATLRDRPPASPHAGAICSTCPAPDSALLWTPVSTTALCLE